MNDTGAMNGYVIWFTGLSGSGKTTLSNLLLQHLSRASRSIHQVDGDVIRARDNNTELNRENIIRNNIRIIEEIDTNLTEYQFVLVSVIAPFKETRDSARRRWKKHYIEVFVKCDQDILIERDVKGLYQKYLSGEMKNLIGMSEIPYESPLNPDVIIDSAEQDPGESIDLILNYLKNNTDFPIQGNRTAV